MKCKESINVCQVRRCEMLAFFFFFKYVDGEMRKNIVDGENKYKGETKIRKRGEFIEIRMIF